ncbi:hypothetical protein CRUP_035689, partial [Coryphaenoides rupestris]
HLSYPITGAADPLGGGGAAGPGGEHLRWQRQAEEQTGERQGEEQRPLELWRDMASFVAGPREDAISTAFSQMLVVSSTEPRTLRNTTHAPPPPGAAWPRPAHHDHHQCHSSGE